MSFFQNINAIFVLIGCVFLGLGAGVIGCYAFLRKRSLMGDALAHAALPGVCAAFILTGTKDPLVILIGAMVSCWLGALSVDAIVKYTRVKEDSALGMVLSVYFGLGILMLTEIQKSGAASQSGLDKFLFGQAAAMVDRDVWLLGILSAVMLGLVALMHKEMKIVSFDPALAATLGLPVRAIQFIMATMIVMAVALGLQAVGVVLMAAMLVTPAAAARHWTDRLGWMLVLAGIFGALSGALGAWISYIGPKMPTGPWMVVAVSAMFFVSILFAPRRGIIARWVRHARNRHKTAMENVLRTLYRYGEESRDWSLPRTDADILKYRTMSVSMLRNTLARLESEGMIKELEPGKFILAEPGIARAARLTRLHRLWELYLTRRVEIAPDHVHDDAEEIEHILTPDLEARLVAALDSPEEDPHQRKIPGEIVSVGAEAAR